MRYYNTATRVPFFYNVMLRKNTHPNFISMENGNVYNKKNLVVKPQSGHTVYEIRVKVQARKYY